MLLLKNVFHLKTHISVDKMYLPYQQVVIELESMALSILTMVHYESYNVFDHSTDNFYNKQLFIILVRPLFQT